MLKRLLLVAALLPLFVTAQTPYFFPGKTFNPTIQSPEQFLGYPIGSHHTRYDRMLAYLRYLDGVSDRMTITGIGETNEHREQILIRFTSPANAARVEAIRQEHLALADPAKPMPDVSKMPVVVQLWFNIHGPEPSGGETSLLASYYLAACENDDVKQVLDQAIVHIEPVLNPDGRDRAAHWFNMHKGSPLVTDPNDREHNEVWPGGRFNHYWFDLNRDLVFATQKETGNRLAYVRQWNPNVANDIHEMGTNSTFFFEPGKRNAENANLSPYFHRDLHDKFAGHFEKAMNEIGSLYYTKESFDWLYPGYTQSYTELQGGIGLLFEQGSSRGHAQESQNGVLPFAFTIRNQITGVMATLRGAVAERETMLRYQRDFYKTAVEAAQKSPVKAWVLGGADDWRMRRMAQVLTLHQIEAYQLGEATTIDGQSFEKNRALVVPTAQPQYRLLQAMFDRSNNSNFQDSVFYDASAWNLALAYGLMPAEAKTPVVRGARLTAETIAPTPPADAPKTNYAYLLDYADFYATRALYQLLDAGLIVKTAFKPFSINTSAGPKKFGYGALLIPVQLQKLSADSIHAVVNRIGRQTGVPFVSVSSGLSRDGVDLGSNAFQRVEKPRALMVVGAGVVPTEAGEVWHLLDQHVGMPITKVEVGTFLRINLAPYTTIVLVSGQYAPDKALGAKLKQWVAGGGTLITFKGATEWAIRNDVVKEKLLAVSKTDSIALAKRTRINFEDALYTEGARNTGGSIFETDLDITHPLGFGITNRKLPVYRNSNTLLELPASPFMTPMAHTAKPLLDGYVHPATLKRIAGSGAVVVSGEGAGRSVLFTFDPVFRATWYGTGKLFLNALFFGPNMTTPGINLGAEE